MKKFADLKITEDGQKIYENINIWDIYRSYNDAKEQGYNDTLKQFYQEKFKDCLFSTHKDTLKKQPLSLCIKEPYSNSYFKYKSSQPEESVYHELFKDIIQNLRKLVLCFNEKQIVLYIKKSEIEYNFNANGFSYRTDIYFEFEKSVPEEYLYKWNGKLYFEIKYSSEVKKEKRTNCIIEQVPMVEHSISKSFIEKIDNISDEKSMTETVEYIRRQLEQKIYVKIISDPTPICYSELIKYKEKCALLNKNNEVFENQIEMLNTINREISLKNDESELKLNQVKLKLDNIYKNKLLRHLIRIVGIK